MKKSNKDTLKNIDKMIRWFVNKWSGIGESDDLYQDAVLVVLSMMQKYSPDRGSLTTYLGTCLSSHFSTIGFRSKRNYDTFVHCEQLESIAPVVDGFKDLEEKLWIEELIQHLSASAVQVLLCLSGFDDAYEEWKDSVACKRGRKNELSMLRKFLNRDIDKDVDEIKTLLLKEAY